MKASRAQQVLFGLLLILVPVLTSACDDSTSGTSTGTTGEATSAVNASSGTIAFLSSQIPGQIHVVRADGGGDRVLTRSTFDLESQPDWSPDGRRVAFVSDRDGDLDIWVMNADGSARRQLTRNDTYEYDPDWSPDGRQIAFERNDGIHDEEIYVISADGTGERQLTSNDVNDYSPSWSPDGRQIAFASDRDGDRRDIYVMNADGTDQGSLTRTRAGGDRPDWEPNGERIVFECGDADLCVMSADGGGFRRLARSMAGQMLAPAWSKDGRTIAFVRAAFPIRDFPYGDIYVMNADGSMEQRLTRDGISGNPSWSPRDRTIAFDSSEQGRSGYTDKLRVWAMSGDGKSKRTLTPAMSMSVEAFPTWSPDGRTLALTTGSVIHLMDADGTNPRRLTRGSAPTWSPDGRRIAFEDDGIWIISADGKGRRQLRKRGVYPTWSPNGQRIAFTVDEAYGAGPLYVTNANGTGTRRLTARRVGWFCWSPDGRRIAFATWQDVDGDAEIYVVNADGSGERQLTDNDDVDIDPQWSPDGRRIAFVSDRDSSDSVLLKGEIYVVDPDGENQQRLTRNSVDDRSPAWSPDGRTIAFVGGSSDGAIVVINVDRSGVQLVAQNASAPTWRRIPDRATEPSDE
jgi:Tol biopolymer transport system component